MEKILLDRSVNETEKHLARLYKSSLAANKREMRDLYNSILEQGNEVKINDLYRFNRYWQVRSDMNNRLVALGSQEQKVFDEDLLDMYMKVQKYFNENPKFWAMTKRGVVKELSMHPIDLNSPTVSINGKYVVDSIWCADGKNWSDRIWKNQDKLAQDLEQGLFDTISRGASPEALITTIEQKYNVAYGRAKTLVRTELAHVYNAAAADRYKEAGCIGYKILVADEWNGWPCDDCIAAGNEGVKPLDDLEVPIHPNCRCTIIPVIGG